MCCHDVQLFLHCSHVTITAKFCDDSVKENNAVLGSIDSGSNAIPSPVRREKHALVSRCQQYQPPNMHSFLLCCSSCRGRVVHDRPYVVCGDQIKMAPAGQAMCSTNESRRPATCERFALNMAPPRLQLDGTAQAVDAPQAPTSAWQASSSRLAVIHEAQAPPPDSMVGCSINEQCYLRFPLTRCHHMIPSGLPRTQLDSCGDSVLVCGCWTGKAPYSPLIPAVLSADVVGSMGGAAKIWDVTGLGDEGCWQCGSLETVMPMLSSSNGQILSHTDIGYEGQSGSGGDALGGFENKTADDTPARQRFWDEVAHWHAVEMWKSQYRSGDSVERAAQLGRR